MECSPRYCGKKRGKSHGILEKGKGHPQVDGEGRFHVGQGVLSPRTTKQAQKHSQKKHNVGRDRKPHGSAPRASAARHGPAHLARRVSGETGCTRAGQRWDRWRTGLLTFQAGKSQNPMSNGRHLLRNMDK